MATSFRKLFDSLSQGLNKMAGIETDEQRDARRVRELNASVAMLLYETARADHDVTREDLDTAERSLVDLLGLPAAQASELMQQVAQPHERPTSYHPLVKAINDQFDHQKKLLLVEHMWHVAHADQDIDKYEDHLIRKISELIYVHHRDFIAAKHRARAKSG